MNRKILSYLPLSYWLIAIFSFNFILFLLFLLTKTFYPILVIAHTMSLLLTWLLIGYKRTFTWEKYRIDIVIGLGLFLLALLIRLWQVETIPPGMYSDEVTVAQHALKIASLNEMPPWAGKPYVTSNHWHPTPLEYLIVWSMDLFGRSITSIRFPVIFTGALTVIVFFTLLRQFFSRGIAAVGGLLLLTSYSHLVLSRLAYEPIPSLLFQLLAFLFTWLYYKYKKMQYLIGIGLSLGAGIYTYLNFRLFAVVLVLLTLVVIIKKVKTHATQHIVFFFMALFIAVTPIASYSILQPYDFFAGRAQELSVLGYPLGPGELPKELMGNFSRVLGVFVGIGDPNPGKNPANQGIFDPVTLLLFYGGLIVLYRKQRWLFFVVLLLIIPPVLSDSLSLERNPDFHYYGIGHPNLLRVSGLLIVVTFAVVWVIEQCYRYFLRFDKVTANISIGFLAIVITFVNVLFYFNQKAIYPLWYQYNYVVNKGPELAVVKKVDSMRENVFYVSPGYLEDEHTRFFSKKDFISYAPTSGKDLETDLLKQPVTVIEVTKENEPYLAEVLQKVESHELPLFVEVLYNPYGGIDGIVFQSY